MYVIGTAGHIDHGKSTLIRALTGIEPDRLEEEQRRGMTIDLGFAWITLPSGREAGIVDVPGHQRFVKNMLAGVTGIDLALFVVAATESWMPQSQEHLDILELLNVRRGIIVLTKADLVDEEWLEVVREDVAERVRNTCLADAPIVAVSATEGTGLDELRALIDARLAEAPPRPDHGRPRMWIDRVFTIRGAGTVVTGTLAGGQLRLEEEVEIYPRRVKARVRGIQTHRRQTEVALPGSRVALNLSGLEREELVRGDVVARPGFLQPSDRLRGLLQLLPHSPRALPSVTEAKVHIGTAERMATIRLLDVDELLPGEEALVELQLDEPVAVELQDAFIVREPGLHATLGGGRVVDRAPIAFSRRRWRRGQAARKEPQGTAATVRYGRGGERVLPAVLWSQVPEPDAKLLRARAHCPLDELPILLLQERWVAAVDQLRREMPMAAERLEERIAAGVEAGQLVRLPSFVWDRSGWEAWQDVVTGELRAFHERYPLRAGAGRETMRSRLGADARLFDESLQRWFDEGVLRAHGAVLALADHRVEYTEAQRAEVERLWALLDAAGFEPPEVEELTTTHGFDGELLAALEDAGELVIVGKGFAYRRAKIDEIEQIVRAFITEHGEMEVAQLRDQLNTSRRYALPLMGYFDEIGVTRRVGDKRVLARDR